MELFNWNIIDVRWWKEYDKYDVGKCHTVKKQRCRISTLKEHYETGDKNRLIYKTLIVFGWFVHLKKFPMPAVQLGFDNTFSVEVGWVSALGDLQVHACQYKGRPRSKDFKLGNLSTAALALHESLDHDLQQPGCCQRASCFWLQNDNNCKCTRPPFSPDPLPAASLIFLRKTNWDLCSRQKITSPN